MDPRTFVNNMPQDLKDAYGIVGRAPSCTEHEMRQTEQFLRIFSWHHDDGWMKMVEEALSRLYSHAQIAFLPPGGNLQTNNSGQRFACDTQGQPCRVLPHISELNLDPALASVRDSGVRLVHSPAEEKEAPSRRYLASPADWNAAFRVNPARTLRDHVDVAKVRLGLPLPPTITETTYESTETYRRAVKDVYDQAAAYMANGGQLTLEESNPNWEMHLVQNAAHRVEEAQFEQADPPIKRNTMDRVGPGHIALPDASTINRHSDICAHAPFTRPDEVVDRGRWMPLPAAAPRDHVAELDDPLEQSSLETCALVAAPEAPILRRSSRRVERAYDRMPYR